jgi:ABC-type transporter Mla subunit MlaD
MGFNRRFYLFLYSPKNIFGCLMGITGLALFFAGLIKAYWFGIVAGLYALGYLLAPANRRLDLKIDAQLDMADILEALESLAKTVRKQKAAKEVVDLVDSIKESIGGILPRLAKQQGALYDAHVIRQTALEYLPDMLETYLALPPAFARLHPVKDGKTATQLFVGQLQLLDVEMKRLAVDILKDDTEALIVHGNFLREKFQGPGKDWLGAG